MKEQSDSPFISKKQVGSVFCKPQAIVLIIIWIISTTTLSIMLINGVRQTGHFRDERNILQIAYILALCWYLIRTGKSIKQLPDVQPFILPKYKFGKLIPVIIITILFLGEFSGQLSEVVWLLLLPTSILILIIWHREIRLPSVLYGLALAIIALLGGLPFYQNKYFSKNVFFLFLAFVIPMFVAGNQVNNRTGLGGSKLYSGNVKKAVFSFLWGCLLFIPLGLTNATYGSPGPWMDWVDHWWIPLLQPLFSGIVEEAWWRLFTINLTYYLLRPAFKKQPVIAISCAILLSAIIFGLGHGGSFQDRVLTIGLLYGLPMAVIFTWRDWEHAIGAHYMINLIPTMMVFLGK